MSFSYDSCYKIPEPLEAYGDIAGLGVVLGFVISTWLTILILVGYYIFAFNPHVDPFLGECEQNKSKDVYNTNPLDVLLAKFTARLRPARSFEGTPTEDAFHKLVTGISILVSGYWSLKHDEGLSAYHWKMVISLAWFSSVTHLSALTFLRGYLAKHPAGRIWRIILMSILLIMLFIGFIPTGHFEFLGDQITTSKSIDLGRAIYPDDCGDFGNNKSHYFPRDFMWGTSHPFDAELVRNGTVGPKTCIISGIQVFQLNISTEDIDPQEAKYLLITEHDREDDQSAGLQGQVGVLYESPAVCFFKGKMRPSSDAFVSMVSSLLLLVYGYLVRAAKVFEGPSKLLSLRIHKALEYGYIALMNKLKRQLDQDKNKGIRLVLVAFLPFQASVYCTLRMLFHLYTSMFAEIFSVLLSGVWGTLNITKTKALGDVDNAEENNWTFGQVISIALLTSALFPILELFYHIFFPTQTETGVVKGVEKFDRATQTYSVAAISEYSEQQVFLASQDRSSRHADADALRFTDQTRAPSHSQPISRSPSQPIPTSPHRSSFSLIVENRLSEGFNAYKNVWTAYTMMIITGPFVCIILLLLPASRRILMISTIFSKYSPTNHLVSSAKIFGFLPCVIQCWIYVRILIGRLPASKKRTVLDFLMMAWFTATGVLFGLGSISGSTTQTQVVIACLVACVLPQLALIMCDLLYVRVRLHRDSDQRGEHI